MLRRPRLLLFALTLIAVGFALGGLERAEPVGLSLENSGVQPLVLPEFTPQLEVPAEFVEPQPAPDAAEADDWNRVTVKSGQSLDGIFRQQGFSPAVLHEILAINDSTRNLKRIRPGDEFAFQADSQGLFDRMRYTVDERNYLLVQREGEGYSSELVERPFTTERRELSGTIESSFFMAGKHAGLSDAKIMDLANNIFGWDIDFILDIRQGDRFHVIYEKIYREGKFLRDGDILAATFVNQGDRFQAVRFETSNGGEYFAPDGRNMKKAFLRAPLNFSYVSSNFNPNRFHPILKRVKAHRGVDYRAPSGTPVYAAGSGRVYRAAYDNANGHHVFIEHAGGIATKYLHFSKRAVKENQRVSQGQVIGYVGSTGLSQAPHLHYEFLVNGTHRNPRTVALPKVEPLSGDSLTAFQAHAGPFLTELSRLESASMFASRE